MPFTGKATSSAGTTLPEIAEHVADLVAIAAATETPLLDLLGDPSRPARSVIHEWLEDAPLPNTGIVESYADPDSLNVEDGSPFRVNDHIRVGTSTEVMRIDAISGTELQVTRGFGGTAEGSDPAAGDIVTIIGNPTIEGADADVSRFTTRTRVSNVTQIFAATVEVSGSELAVNQLGVKDEMDYQKAMRLRELLRDLENSVINGAADDTTPGGSADTPRSMRGIIASIQSHRFAPGVDDFPADTTLTEQQLNLALRTIWEGGGTGVDLIVVGGRQKRAINGFITSNRRYFNSTESYRDMVSAYESDFGVCRVVLSRHVPPGAVLLLDSARIGVLPLAGRSFQFKPLSRTGDRESGQVIGEYTLELRNEGAHGLITGLAA